MTSPMPQPTIGKTGQKKPPELVIAHDERVHEDIHEQMRREVVAFLQLPDGAVTHRIGQRFQITSHAYSPTSRCQVRNVDQGGPESLVPRSSRKLAERSLSAPHSWCARSEIWAWRRTAHKQMGG